MASALNIQTTKPLCLLARAKWVLRGGYSVLPPFFVFRGFRPVFAFFDGFPALASFAFLRLSGFALRAVSLPMRSVGSSPGIDR